MPPKKKVTKRKQAWLNVVNRAIEQDIQPIVSASKHVRYLRVPNVGRVDLERNGALTDAGRDWHKWTNKRWRAATTIPRVNYEDARE